MLRMMMIAGVLAALTACNTVEGVGEDIQQGGQAIEGAAN